MTSSLALQSAPLGYPVTVDEVKLHSRVTNDAEDAHILRAIAAATERVQEITGQSLITQTWVEYFDAFPHTIYLRKAPVQSVTSIKYIDTNDVEQTLNSTNYDVDVISKPARIIPSYGNSWPSGIRSKLNPIYVEYITGFGADSSYVPDTIKWAMYMLIGHFYENREATTDLKLVETPEGVHNLLYSHKLWWMR